MHTQPPLFFGIAMLWALLATLDTAAQQQDSVGFGALKRTFNMTDLAGTQPDTAADEDIRGVVSIDGLLYVAGTNGGPLDDHKVYVVDPDSTTLLGSFSLPEPHQSSEHGALGLDADCSGNIIAAGAEGIAVFDTAGNQVDHIDIDCNAAADAIMSIPLPVDENGDPVVEAEGGAEYCGVALDEDGDGGTGSLWIAECDPIEDDPPSIIEIRIADGTVLQEFPSQGHTTNALVIDPITGNFWTNSDNPFEIIELDSITLEPTGQAIQQVPPQPGMLRSFGFGGLAILPGGDPAHPWDSFADLVSVSQQARVDGTRKDDFIGFHRLHQQAEIPGYTESALLGSTNLSPLDGVSPIAFGPGDVLNWMIEPNGRPNFGLPALNVLNIGPDALVDGLTDLAVLGMPGVLFPELVALSPISVPPAATPVFQNTDIGVLSSLPLPAGFPSVTGIVLRLQSIYSDPGIQPLGLAASNELCFESLVLDEVTFEMDAPSAFHVDLLDPFIRLTEHSGNGDAFSIVKLVVDLRGDATLPPTYVFDVTQGSMYDIFAAGNGPMDRCTGTYREGSDLDTGLIYADGLMSPQINTPYNLGRDGVLGLSPGAGHPVCFRELWPDPTASQFPYQSGFLASTSPPGGDPRFPTRLEFNFTPGMFLGKTFKFDVDIDGGPDSGGDLAGTWVAVHLNNGTVYSGTTLPDGTNPDRSVIGW